MSGPVVLMDSVITVTGIHEISTILSDINQYALNKLLWKTDEYVTVGKVGYEIY